MHHAIMLGQSYPLQALSLTGAVVIRSMQGMPGDRKQPG